MLSFLDSHRDLGAGGELSLSSVTQTPRGECLPQRGMGINLWL